MDSLQHHYYSYSKYQRSLCVTASTGGKGETEKKVKLIIPAHGVEEEEKSYARFALPFVLPLPSLHHLLHPPAITITITTAITTIIITAITTAITTATRDPELVCPTASH